MNQNAPTADKTEAPAPDKEQLMEQYKTYLDTVDYSAEKRLQVHEFFMGINSFLGTLFGYLTASDKYTMDDIVVFLVVAACVGFSLSRVWYFWVVNFTLVNSAKWNVIYDMEKNFPYQPFQSEWEVYLKQHRSKTPPKRFSWLWTPKKKRRYYSNSELDSILPQLFGRLYILLGIISIAFWVYKSDWLHSENNPIGNILTHILDFLKEFWRLGLAWVGIVILILVLFIVVFVAMPLNRRK